MLSSVADAQKKADESLVGFPSHVVQAYLAYAQSGDQRNLDVVVLGVLHFYLAKKPADALDSLPGTTRLMEDLGCDSLTMMDMVFMMESLFDIKLDDTELTKIATLDDLRAQIRRHVISKPTPTT